MINRTNLVQCTIPLRWGLVALATIAGFGAPSRVAGADIVINSTDLTITGDTDSNPATFNGVPFKARVEDNIARFYIAGDLSLAATDTVTLMGSRPVSLFVGGQATIPAGVVFDASANGPIPGPGGGAGGIHGQYGSIGFGGYIYTVDISIGGAGGHGVTAANGTSGQIGALATAEAQIAAGDGVDGFLGDPGQDGVNSPGSGGSSLVSRPAGGAAGDSGVHGQGGSGGGGGAYVFFAGTNGGSGGKGGDGQNGSPGKGGTNGQQGTPGINTGTGDTISGGGGGSGGSGGGGGGGGGYGGNGAGGGGGGGGGGSGFTGAGGAGGAGGDGGNGDLGGDGGIGGIAGAGGAGGGALEIIVCGRMTVAAHLLARGDAGESGEPGKDGSMGIAGAPGTVGASGKPGDGSSGSGGHGGAGGNGGDGAAGGKGGDGGDGGGGGGGAIKLAATTITSAGCGIDVSGGTPNGGIGRFLFGSSTVQSYDGSTTGVTMTPVYGSRIRNPFLADGGETPYIVALAGGPEAFGLLDGYTAASPEFAAITSTAPSGATVALVRRSVGPAGLSDTYPGFSVLFYINISGGDLALPTLGVGDRDYAQPLQLGGFTRRVEFGGDGGISPLAVLPAGAIYATLVPDGSITYTFGYTAGPNVVRRRVVSLVLNTPVYLTTQSASREWLDYE